MSQTLKLISLIALFWVVSAMPQKILASDAMTAFNKKDYNEAYRIWRRSPDSTESQYGIGRLFFEGLGGPDGHFKLPHLWPVKFLQARRFDYAVC
jgi:hypothetical protein